MVSFTEKVIALESNADRNPTAGVRVWEYTSDGNSYIIFGGYENYGNIPTVIDINPLDKVSHINPKNLKMIWGYESCPKSICAVTLSFFSRYTPNGHPIYVQIWANNPSFPEGYNTNSTGINQTKDKLKKIADTIEDSQTYH